MYFSPKALPLTFCLVLSVVAAKNVMPSDAVMDQGRDKVYLKDDFSEKHHNFDQASPSYVDVMNPSLFRDQVQIASNVGVDEESKLSPPSVFGIDTLNDGRCMTPDVWSDMYAVGCSSDDSAWSVEGGNMLKHVKSGKCLWADGMLWAKLSTCNPDKSDMLFQLQFSGCTDDEEFPICSLKITPQQADTKCLTLHHNTPNRLVFEDCPSSSPTLSPIASPSSSPITPLKVQKVKVQGFRYKAILMLAEVEVYDESNVNQALNKPSTQKSTEWKKGANFGNDGDINTWTRTYKHNSSPFWQVDLGSEIALSKVTIYNRQDCCQNELSDFTVYLLDGTDTIVGTYDLGDMSNTPMIEIDVSSF